MASNAKVLLSDGPIGNLATEKGQIVIDILKRLVVEEDYCVIVATHDLGIAAQADIVYRMSYEKLIWKETWNE